MKRRDKVVKTLRIPCDISKHPRQCVGLKELETLFVNRHSCIRHPFLLVVVQQQEDVIAFVGIRVLLALATLDHLRQRFLVQIDVLVAPEGNRPEDEWNARRQRNLNRRQLEGFDGATHSFLHLFR